MTWRVDGALFRESFKKEVQADSFRSDLGAAANKAKAFSTQTGRPLDWSRAANRMAWYDFATSCVDMKWKDASAKHRADIARVLMLITLRFFTTERGKPGDEALRRALSRWGFNTKQRPAAPPDAAEVSQWGGP